MINLPLDKMPFQFAVLDFKCIALDPIYFDKFPGFIIHSGFGHALRKLCPKKSRNTLCMDCFRKDICPYSYIYETLRPENNDIDFTAEHFPHPFVFYPHFTESKIYGADENLTLTLTLFGDGIPYLLFYIYAFDLLGEMGLGSTRGKYCLEKVTDKFSKKILYQHQDKTLRGEPGIHSISELACNDDPDTITVIFQTPAKIEEKSRTTILITPDMLIRRLLRRASLLCERHQKEKWDIDFHTIIDDFKNNIRVHHNNLQLERLRRFSARQRRTHPVFTVKGHFSLSGHIYRFFPILKLGSYTHIGNSTSQGLGKYFLHSDH